MPDEPYHYTECGLDDVWLIGGVEQRTFGDYGAGVFIHDETKLLQGLATSIVNQDSRMVGQELRFLRTLLDWTQPELGRRLGYRDGQLVGSWERATHKPVSLIADTFLRAAYREKTGKPARVTRLNTRLSHPK